MNVNSIDCHPHHMIEINSGYKESVRELENKEFENGSSIEEDGEHQYFVLSTHESLL